MKRLTLEQWEKKYITKPLEQFDQKNTMFTRPGWDQKTNDLLDDWTFNGEVNDSPGYDVRAFALRRASQNVTRMLGLGNISKPNPSPASKAVMKTVFASSPTMTKPADLQNNASFDVGTPQSITLDVKKAATYFGADLVGVCKLDRRWVYSHTYQGKGPSEAQKVAPGKSIPQEIPETFQYAVVMAFGEAYDMLRYYPTWVAHAVTSHGYSRMAITNSYVSGFIKNLGFKAIDCTTNDVALTTPMAMQAGLGDLGRHGLLITPEYGPRVRLSKILTDLPLVPDSPIDFGVTEFCDVCMKCADMCPSQSIMHGERTAEPNNVSNLEGTLKWPLNAETCRMYWGKSSKPCTTCIACCPYNKPHTLFHRTVKWFADYARWADPFYVKMDDLFGYGKPRSPDRFWEKWQPKNHH